MHLVKDLHEQRIVYYWIDEQETQISPFLASIPLAEEWRNLYLHKQYQGWDRRRSHIDRRRLVHKRDQASAQHAISNPAKGRRSSDKPIKVDIDLAKSKLEKLFLTFRENASQASEPTKPKAEYTC